MIRMNVQQTANRKSHVFTYADMSARSLCGLARKLKAAGYEDQPFEVCRDGLVSMTGKSLFWTAGKSLQESDKGFRYVDYKPCPEIKKPSQKKKLSLQMRVRSRDLQNNGREHA